AGAGMGAYYTDQMYLDAGAEIVADTANLFSQAEIVLKVQKPIENKALDEHEVDLMPEGSAIISFLASLTSPELVKKLAERKVTAFGMEAVPRITRAQSMDAL